VFWGDFLRICGLQKLAMVDYPGKLAATVFTGGCNLRCPFCHNALLVTQLNQNPESHTEEEILTFLRSRKGLLDGMVLSGGEPLLQDGVPESLKRVKALGLSVKLDTNGCYPDILAELLAQNLVDYVAMDIKNSREQYAKTVGLPDFDLTPIEKSIQLLKESGIDYEFRTTVVREFHTVEDIQSIGIWCQGAPRYFLQNFVDSGNLIGKDLHAVDPLELQAFAEAVRPYFKDVCLRGVD